MEYEVIVELKKEVLDPEGRAIQETLARLGHDHLKTVKVSKRFLVELDEKAKNPESLVNEIAREYLANPVAEVFKVRSNTN